MPSQSENSLKSPDPFMKVFRSMLRNLFVAFALIVSASLTSYAQAPPSADAYVTSAQPAANFGISPLLPVQAGTTSYVRLNLGALPANATIAKATLRLYVNAVAAPGSFDVYQVENGWSEKGLSFNSAPALGASATGERPVPVTAASQNQFILVDITALVQGWLNGSIPNHGVALALSSSGGSFSFDSKESVGTGHQPELEVVLGSAVGALTASSGAPMSTSTVAAVMPQGKLQGTSDPFVDNGTALQVGANFNIDGTGSANTMNALSQFQLGGAPLISMSAWMSQSLGYYAGANNTGNLNTFAGVFAGANNTSGAFNTVVGAQANNANQTGSYNTIVGAWAGLNNTGTNNSFYGAYAGYSTTTGVNNMFFGTNAGHMNTTGNNNFFLGAGSGYNNTTGSNNTFLGYLSGQNADATASNNLYVGSLGAAGESGAIRIGDPVNQTAAYLAGINGASTTNGLPVFVDSTGKLGTGGGSVNFTQVVGTLISPQFTGTYNNSVTLSNSSNSFTGSFAGNGTGLAGVSSGLSWPIVTKNADYSIQTSDFSTSTQYGNFLILTGTVSHTFTLPPQGQLPPNGSCVAIGNVADGGINSNRNTFLTVAAPSGVLIDASATISTQARRLAYLYCSNGTGYYRLGYNQNGVSEIGPYLETLDTGTVDVLQTTFRNGIDFGLLPGTMFYIRAAHNNTSSTPTLNVNGLGAKHIVKFGNLPLAPNDLTTAAYAQVFYDGTNWQLLNPQTVKGTVTAVLASAPLASSGGPTPVISCPACVTTPTLTGTTASIGGGALTAGSCTTGTASVTGATVGHPVSVSAADGSLPNGLIILRAAVTGPNTVTVQLCATAGVTPLANTYNVATQ